MKAIFYDRKNDLTVSSEELQSTKSKDGRPTFVEHILTVDEDGYGCKEWTDKEKQPAYVSVRSVADFVYKSKNCPNSQNWDKWCFLSDLVFLKLEE